MHAPMPRKMAPALRTVREPGGAYMDVERLRREMPEELPEDERPEELPEREDEALEPESPGDRPAGARPDRGGE